MGENDYYKINIAKVSGAEKVKVPAKELYSDIKDFAEEYFGYHWNEDEEAFGYYFNPNSKWDWYEIGGRWAGALRVKKDSISAREAYRGGKSWTHGDKDPYKTDDEDIVLVDSARIKDIILKDENKYQKASRFWELYIEEQEPQNDEERESIQHVFYRKEYLLEKYKTKEAYADAQSSFATYSVLKDGEWIEPGAMGWFGCSSASSDEEGDFERNFKANFIDNADEDDWITIVDCHI
jgi:hypothetical protein